MSRSVQSRPEPGRRAAQVTAGRAGRLGRALLVGAATGAALVVLALLVRGQWRPLINLDQRAVDAGASLAASNATLLRALLAWQWLFLASHLVLPVIALCVLYWWCTRNTTRALWAIATVLVAWGLSNLVKDLVGRARPVLHQPVESAPGYSFPSGHAANTAAMTTVLVLLVWPHLHTRGLRVAAVGGAAVLTLLTAADRVLLGVHFPSDVVAGILFGVGVAVASYLAYRHWSPSHDATSDAETGDTA